MTANNFTAKDGAIRQPLKVVGFYAESCSLVPVHVGTMLDSHHANDVLFGHHSMDHAVRTPAC